MGLCKELYFLGYFEFYGDLFEEPFFQEMEVLEALKSLKEDKAPGPNGFPMKFFKECWGMVDSEVMKDFGDFHENASLCRSLNLLFIVLIPKNQEAFELKDFWPLV